MPGRHNNDVFKKGWTTMYKNIDKQTKLTLKELVEYQEGQVVSKTLVQNDYVSMTIFSFCLLYTSPSPRDRQKSRMPSSA